ncbi:DNA-methyltransferase [Bradyrhizobium oligotrophicum]|uniref:DNA-methyltransferase n=1 Tax=Bradyrhizobium oligotrophicum TaxID=44255 RepID=UPI003EBD39C8
MTTPFTLLHGDCLDLMHSIPEGSIDLILCDLPYGTTQNSWDSVLPLDAIWLSYRRIIKPNSAIVLTASQPFSSALVMSNHNEFKYQWVWVKTKITGVLNAKRMPVRKHEQVLVFSPGKPIYIAQGLIPANITRRDKVRHSSDNYGKRGGKEYVQEWTNWPRDVLEVPSEGKTVHPTQKPVALMEYLIRTYTNEGDVVLDNCMGSGTTGVACVNTGRRFIGMERDAGYFKIASDRIRAAYAVPEPSPQADLFAA